MYGIPEGSQRGGHAHKYETQVLIAISGQFVVKIFDGQNWEEYLLDSPDKGLYVPPLFWRELCRFSGNAVCLTLSSTKFDAEEYLSPMEEYTEYLASLKQQE